MKIFKCKLKNDQQVLGVLKKNTKGISAYGVLKELQRYKNVTPMTVYRSLKNLQNMGAVHKSNQSKNYFVCHNDSKGKHNAVLAICSDCGSAEELKTDIFSRIIKNVKSKKKFNFDNFNLEITTTCGECA
mgnify:FL=1